MAVITKITHEPLTRDAPHTAVECTYDVLIVDNVKYLQLDTYGSKMRAIKGKKSQTLRLTPEAIAQLKVIFEKHAL